MAYIIPHRLNSGTRVLGSVSETVTLDRKGRLVLPKGIREAAHLRVNATLVIGATGEGHIELLDPALLLRKGQM